MYDIETDIAYWKKQNIAYLLQHAQNTPSVLHKWDTIEPYKTVAYRYLFGLRHIFWRNNHVTATEFKHTTLQFVNKRSTNWLNGRVFGYKLNSCETE